MPLVQDESTEASNEKYVHKNLVHGINFEGAQGVGYLNFYLVQF